MPQRVNKSFTMTENPRTYIPPMDFHACDTPRGMMYYNLQNLTAQQQEELNAVKLETMREDEKYLAAHPEIRAIVAIITRLVLRVRPRDKITDVIGEYFAKSRIDIESNIDEYINAREPHKYEAISSIDLWPPHSKSHISIYEDDVIEVSGEDVYLANESSVRFDFKSSLLLQAIRDSMKNLGVDFTKMKDLPSHSLMQSISEIVGATPPSRVKIVTPNRDEDVEDEEPFGHIPRIEDYDAGFCRRRRRQTFTVADDTLTNFAKQCFPHIEGSEDQGTVTETMSMESGQATTEDETMLEEIEGMGSEGVTYKSSIDEFKFIDFDDYVCEGVSERSYETTNDSEMKPLIEPRDLRVSVEKDKTGTLFSESEIEESEIHNGDHKPLAPRPVPNEDHQFDRLHLDVVVKQSKSLEPENTESAITQQTAADSTVSETDPSTDASRNYTERSSVVGSDITDSTIEKKESAKRYSMKSSQGSADRQRLSQAGGNIKKEFSLNKERSIRNSLKVISSSRQDVKSDQSGSDRPRMRQAASSIEKDVAEDKEKINREPIKVRTSFRQSSTPKK